MVLHHREQVRVLTIASEKRAGERSVASRMRDGHMSFRFGFEGIVGMDEQLQLPAVLLAQLGTKPFQIVFKLCNMSADRAFGVTRTWLSPIQVSSVTRVRCQGVEGGFVVAHFGYPQDRPLAFQ